ncbi:MAG: hypothetical protein NT168_13540 [Planctomycetota bacterium]|nr:hypothetical protein [Planctomycetota bacterium]
MLPIVLVLVLEEIQYINPPHWSASSREPLRSTVGIVAVQTAIEYEYRFTEYRPPWRTEYEYDEIRGEGTNEKITVDEELRHQYPRCRMPQAPGRLVRPEAQLHQLAGGCVVKWEWWR